MTKIRKGIINTVIIFFEIVIGITLIFQLLKVNMKMCYRTFYNDTEIEFEIPDLSSEIVPQGLDYCQTEDVFIMSGYMADTNESTIYVIKRDGSYRKISVLKANGKPLRSHSGGIAICGDYIYIAGGNGNCYALSRKDILEEENDTAAVIGSFYTHNSASFCYAKDGYLYVGEYYHSIKYNTKSTHQMTTPDGTENNAVILAFPVNEKTTIGVSRKPSFACSITGRVQGMTITDSGYLVLSASSVLQGSQLYYYDYEKITQKDSDAFKVAGKEIPLYYFDKTNRIKKIEILPKSEEIVTYDGKIYMLFESACKRFKFGKMIDGQYVYSMPIDIDQNRYCKAMDD